MIVGVDYAQVDGNLPPGWHEAREGCRAAGSTLGFAIFRAAFGTSPDPTIGRDWIRARDAGLTVGAYLFLRMRRDQAPEDQVHVFADNVGTLTGADLVPTIDVEDTRDDFTAEDELEYVHRAWTVMRSIYGAAPMLYLSDRVWREDLHDLPAGEMTDSPLWLAKPWPWRVRTAPQLSQRPFDSGNYDPTTPRPWGWGNWWMHQYQGDAIGLPGFTQTVDLSRFHVMRQGEIGIRVAWMQRRLGWPVTRTFDADTAQRVREFQASHGLVTDAIIGPKTFARVAWTAERQPFAA